MDGASLIQTSQEEQGAVLPTVGSQALPDSACLLTLLVEGLC